MTNAKKLARIKLDLVIWLTEQLNARPNERVTRARIKNDCFYYRNYRKEPDIYDTALTELLQSGVVLELVIDGRVYYSLNKTDTAGSTSVLLSEIAHTEGIETSISSESKPLDPIYDKEL